MSIFITGACSFVGKELISKCKERQIEYAGVDLAVPREGEYLTGDITSKDISDLIPEKADALVHLAAISRDSDCKDNAYECFRVNVQGTLNLIDASRKRKVNQFIFASTEWVYGAFAENEIKNEETPIDISSITSEYALSKLVSEANIRQTCQHGFCHATILRFGIIYGPRSSNWSAVESVFSSVKNKEEISIGSLKTARCFIHVSDIASGIISSIGLSGLSIINVQGDKPISLNEIIVAGKKILKRNPRIIETNPGNPSIRQVSNEKAKRLLKWKPEINLETGLKTLINFI